MALDASALQDSIRDAARTAFRELQQSHPEETFYAFALYTDGGLMTVMPAANTEEAFEDAADGESDRAELAAYRWSTGEWAHEGAGDEHFDAVCQVLRDAALEQAAEEDSAAEAFRARANLVIRSMIGALHQLDEEGLFGRDKAREKVTLFVSVSDSDGALAIETKSAEQLNPPRVAAKFAKRWG